jgi:nucleoside-diphosphate-sugar epimerase
VIAVTGASGLVGSHLLFELLKSEEKVHAISRSKESHQHLSKVFEHYENGASKRLEKVVWHYGSINDIPFLESLIKDAKLVYHCAALVSFSNRDRDLLFKTNVEGTHNVVNACLKFNIPKLCHVSSTSAFPKPKNVKIISEKLPWTREIGNSSYSQSKFMSEREVWRGSAEGLNMVIVNPCVVVGPGKWDESSNTIFKTTRKGSKYYTKGGNAIVDARDVAKIMILLVKKDVRDERFLLIGENLSFKRLLDLIADAYANPKPKKLAKKWMTAFAYRFESFVTWFSGKRPRMTKQTHKNLHGTLKYSNEKIRKELDYNFIPAEEAIRNACNFYKKKN